MSTWSAAENNIYARMEVEANRFAALMLMPPPLLRPYLAKTGDPKIDVVLSLHEDFGVSKDAAARAYTQFHDEPIAMAIVHDGKLLRAYRAPKAPALCVNHGDAIPRPSSYWRTRGTCVEMTELTEVPAGHWLTSDWGKKLPNLYEQVLHQLGDYAMILLWPEFEEEDEDFDPDEDRTSKQRLADRVARSQR